MRNRILKEGFFRNYDLACLPPLARILFQGLWCMADKEGRLVDQPPRIKADVLPYDDCDIAPFLDSLHTLGFIARYEVSGRRFIQIVNFVKHQSLTSYEKNQTVSEIPPLSVEATSDRPAEPHTVTSEELQKQNKPASDSLPLPANGRPAGVGEKGQKKPSSTSEELQKNFRSGSERTEQNRTDSAKAGAERAPTIWDVGVPLLTGAGVAERDARSILGRLAKKHGNAAVASAIAITSQVPRANPHEYLVAVLSREQTPRTQAELNRGGGGPVI